MAAAHELYLREGLGSRDDAAAMQYLIPGVDVRQQASGAAAMKVLIADANLVPHRERLEAGLPDGCAVAWFPAGARFGGIA